jgi:hypothetical protein
MVRIEQTGAEKLGRDVARCARDASEGREKQMPENQKPNSLIIAALMRGRIAQILTDAETHPDTKARARLTASANRIADIVNGKLTPELTAQIEEIEAALALYRAAAALVDLPAGVAAEAAVYGNVAGNESPAGCDRLRRAFAHHTSERNRQPPNQYFHLVEKLSPYLTIGQPFLVMRRCLSKTRDPSNASAICPQSRTY